MLGFGALGQFALGAYLPTADVIIYEGELYDGGVRVAVAPPVRAAELACRSAVSLPPIRVTALDVADRTAVLRPLRES